MLNVRIRKMKSLQSKRQLDNVIATRHRQSIRTLRTNAELLCPSSLISVISASAIVWHMQDLHLWGSLLNSVESSYLDISTQLLLDMSHKQECIHVYSVTPFQEELPH